MLAEGAFFMKTAQKTTKTFIWRALPWVLVFLTTAAAVYLLTNLKSDPAGSSLPADLAPAMTYEVVKAYPHDPQAFTQGLIYLDGFLYESTGRYGESTLRQVDLHSGEVLQQVSLPEAYFAEGLTEWADTLVQLTWREGTGFVYDQADFSLLKEFSYETQGWGLTHDNEHLIMSDGTQTLYFLDPKRFTIVDRVTVRFQGEEITQVNELEYIRGEVFANIWQTDSIARIDPTDGRVTGWIDLTGLLPPEERTPDTNVLNGIAYDAEQERLFVTGKRWPKLYQIRLIPLSPEE